MRVRPLFLGILLLLLGLSMAVGNDRPLLAQAQDNDQAAADDGGRVVYVITVEGLISDVMHTSIQRRIAIAEEAGADLIVLEIDTYGGLVTSALEIANTLKNQQIETLAWVNDKAISAGAMIAVAADGIVVTDPASMGDAAPIALGQQLGPAERAKIESPILESFRDSARRNGYPVVLTEVMVRLGPAVYAIENIETGERRYVYSTELGQYGLEPLHDDTYRPLQQPRQPQQEEQPGFRGIGLNAADIRMQADEDAAAADEAAEPVEDFESEHEDPEPEERDAWEFVTAEDWSQPVNPENMLLTLSATEAIQHGFAREVVMDDEALMAFTDTTEENFHRLGVTWSETLANWLVSPGVQFVLMIMVFIGVYMEIQSPGLGVPGAVAAGALLLLVGGPFIAGLAGMTELLLIAAGLILIGVELFLLPGLGIVGLGGVLMVLAGFLMLFVPPEPEPGWLPTLDATWDGLRTGVMVVTLATIGSAIAGYFIARNIERVPMFRRLVLESTVDSASVHPAGAASRDDATRADGSTPTTLLPGERAGPVPPPESPIHEGAEARALTGLRPAGRVRLDGEIIDVVTAGRWVEPGETVRIIEVRGNRVVVEKV